jgi:hypothetical protein
VKRVISNIGRLSIPGDIKKLFGGKLDPLYVCMEHGSNEIYITNRTPEYTNVQGINCTDLIIGVPDICKENRISLSTCTRETFGFGLVSVEILLQTQKFISSAGYEYFKVYLRLAK